MPPQPDPSADTETTPEPPRRLLSEAQLDGLARILGPAIDRVAARHAAAEARAQAQRADSASRPK